MSSRQPTLCRRGQCWPKECRLRKRREYQTVQRGGRRFSTRDLVILWRKGQTPVTRLGVTVSRRVAKQAVRRNRVKRWIREAFRRLPLEDASLPMDIAVIGRGSAVTSSYAAIVEQLREFWKFADRH